MKRSFLALLLFAICFYASPQRLEVVQLKCANKTNPLGIESTSPVLSWQLRSNQRRVLQTGYSILVSDNLASLKRNIGNVWETKKVNSSASIQVSYKGKKLAAAKTYYWKVMVWDNKKNISAWSKAATWQMGLLEKADWKNAKWIAYEKMEDSLRVVPAEHGKGTAKMAEVKDVLPLIRKKVVLDKPIQKATIFICGLGQFEMNVNGKKVGDHFLDPGWTEYDKEGLYVTFDVTSNLQKGANAIGIMLGNGFYFMPRQRYRKLTGSYGFPKMILRLYVQYKDGSEENILSDETWKTAPSPVTFSSIYGGEDYNATLEEKGWDTPAFNASNWKNAIAVEGPPKLASQITEPLKIMEKFTVVKITSIKDSVYVYDLGQNAAGIPQISVKGKKGDAVRLVPAELLKEDGTASQRAMGSPVYFDYILKGDGVETWHPYFSYYGFRYLQVERAVPLDKPNPSQLPVVVDLVGLHTRNAAETVGSFTSSNKLFNKTFKLIDWSIKSNMESILTDCPHREKLGWLEQVHLMGNSIRYNYDMSNFFKKTVRDMMDAQTPEDVVPEYAPEYVKMPFMDGVFMDSPEWGSTSIILPWYLYQWYGDKEVLTESYPMIQRYLSHLQKKSKDYIVSYGLGDWYDLGPNKPGLAQLTPIGITATATYYYDLTLAAKISRLIGEEQNASEYDELAIHVKNAFNKTFFNKETKQYGTGSQTANSIAVFMNLVNPEDKAAVINNIVKDVRAKNNSLTTGDVGYRYLLKVLDDAGRSDVIFNMNSRSDVPGYGYQIAKGATSLTESWQALPSVSNNHLMLGHLMEWFYAGLAGIRQNDTSIAFKTIEIRPQPVGDVTFAKASHESLYGKITSEWRKKGKTFELKVTIPANTTATIMLPAGKRAVITESGKLLKKGNNIEAEHTALEKDKSFHVGSGSYTFKVVNK